MAEVQAYISVVMFLLDRCGFLVYMNYLTTSKLFNLFVRRVEGSKKAEYILFTLEHATAP